LDGAMTDTQLFEVSMISPYLKRPIRTLEQALRDCAWARSPATLAAPISLTKPGTSLVPPELVARALPCVIACPALTARPMTRTAPDREAA